MNATAWRFWLLVCCLSVYSCLVSAQEPNKLDGGFWLEMSQATEVSRSAKALFVTGLLTGLRTAPALLVSTWTGDSSGEHLASLRDYVDRFLQSMPTAQTSAGLDAFYADYANRKIRINDAAAVVLRRIVGDDESRIGDWVKLLRERAAQGGDMDSLGSQRK